MAALAFWISAADWSAFDFHSWIVAWLAKSCWASVACRSIFGLVVFLRRLVGGERRLLLVDLRLIDVALDAEQLRALLDHGAVDVVDRGEKALHARDKVDGGESRGVAGQLEILGHRLLERLGHDHLGRRRRHIGVPGLLQPASATRGCAEARRANSPRADSSPGPKVTHQNQRANPRQA